MLGEDIDIDLGKDFDEIVKDVMVNVFNEGWYEYDAIWSELSILGRANTCLILRGYDNTITLEISRTNEKYSFIVTRKFVNMLTNILKRKIKPKLEELHQDEIQLYKALQSKGYLDDGVLKYIKYDWRGGKVSIEISDKVPFARGILEGTGLNTRTFEYNDVEALVDHIGRVLGMLRELDTLFKDYGRLKDSINDMLKGISDDIKDSALKTYWG